MSHSTTHVVTRVVLLFEVPTGHLLEPSKQLRHKARHEHRRHAHTRRRPCSCSRHPPHVRAPAARRPPPPPFPAQCPSRPRPSFPSHKGRLSLPPTPRRTEDNVETTRLTGERRESIVRLLHARDSPTRGPAILLEASRLAGCAGFPAGLLPSRGVFSRVSRSPERGPRRKPGASSYTLTRLSPVPGISESRTSHNGFSAQLVDLSAKCRRGPRRKPGVSS